MFCPACFHDKPDIYRCPSCNFVEEDERDALLLPYRTTLRARRYVIGVVLGKPGGFGVAYKALDTKHGALVVVKESLLTASNQVERFAGDPLVHVNPGFEQKYRKWLERFRNEARIISRFTNPHIVRVSDLFEENNTGYYVMPFVASESLGAFCAARGGHLPEAEVAELARSLLGALSEMHAQNMVHRDISPSNILMTAKGPVLIDFGAARDHFDDEASRSHMMVHKPTYAPFEQVMGLSTQGPWTDIYSLCATLHFCLVGKPPPASSARYSVDGSVVDPFVPLHQRLRELGSALAMVIDNGLAVLPRGRLKSASMALRTLEGDATSPPSPPPPPPAVEVKTTLKGISVLAAPPPVGPTSPAAPQPKALWALLPAVVVLLFGLTSDSYAKYLNEFAGLFVCVNVGVWVLWFFNRTSPKATTHTQPPLSTTGTLSNRAHDAGTLIAGIELIMSPQDSDTVRRVVPLGTSVVVGRSGQADIHVPSRWLSLRHLRIVANERGEFELTDLDSTNWTYVQDHHAQGGAGAWKRIQKASGQRGRFMMGPPTDGGVLLEIRPAGNEP